MKIKKTSKAEIVVLQKALREIQSFFSTLNSADPKQLESQLGDLESKISALRSFLCNHLMRGELEKSH
jgi:hypothetical protein